MPRLAATSRLPAAVEAPAPCALICYRSPIAAQQWKSRPRARLPARRGRCLSAAWAARLARFWRALTGAAHPITHPSVNFVFVPADRTAFGNREALREIAG